MTRVLFGAGQCLFAFLFAMPGCFKSNEAPPPTGPRVGMTAPDIQGEDLEGVPFKLSDYRGKVAVVSFWASWCPPCRALIPHERHLVEKYKDRPFVMLGVNADQDKKEALEVASSARINWRSWWDGGNGAIQTAFNIRAYPTIYIIDDRGVIRHEPQPHPNVGREIEQQVERLLAEAEARR